MRILILTGIFPPDIGGPATQLDALARALIKHRYQVSILTFGKSDKTQYLYPVKRVSRYWPGCLKGFIYLLKGFFLALKSDILYSQDLYTAGLASLIIKKILRKPLVTRFVGDSAWETARGKGWINDDIVAFQEKKYSWFIELRKKIRKKILLNSDKVIVASYFLQGLAQKIGLPKEKIKVIYNSVDFLKTEPSLNKKELREKFSFQGKALLTMARLTPWKGVDTLIKLMPSLIQKYKEIHLVIVGQGPELARLKQLSQHLHLQDNVFFVGKLNRQEVVDYLSSADVFVLNTEYEGMSHCLLEAMKLGLAIITTKSGGNPETIKHGQTGLLVEYNNKEQWLKAISLILDNPDLAAKLVSQAKQDLQQFSWSKLVAKTIRVLKYAQDSIN